VVEQATRSPESPRKWQLRVRLQSVEGLYGGTFVHEGETVDSFAFDLPGEPAGGHELVAEAEYLGGPRGGTLQLHQVELDPS
jgi:hypothetical protein